MGLSSPDHMGLSDLAYRRFYAGRVGGFLGRGTAQKTAPA
jgi:hypothetical protein